MFLSSIRELYRLTSRRNMSADASSIRSVHRSVIYFPLLENRTCMCAGYETASSYSIQNLVQLRLRHMFCTCLLHDPICICTKFSAAEIETHVFHVFIA